MENWCEYVSQEGEIKNVLQFLCECEDLDDSFTNLVSLARRGPDDGGRSTSGWQRVLRVAQDRARVPWPGGARRVDLAWSLAAALLWLLRFMARRTATITEVVILLAACFGGLGYSHLTALRRGSNSQLHMAWLTLSVAGIYSCYSGVVGSELSWIAYAIAHASLLAMGACYLCCCLLDPGREQPVAENLDSSTKGGMSAESTNLQAPSGRHPQQLPVTRRSGRCRICRCTFRARDHHCVWVGQCIAERNRRFFLFFLVLLSGLSFWFSLKMMALSAGAAGGCGEGLPGQLLWPRLTLCLLRRNSGGEEASVGLYALIAGFLTMGLASQQCFLVSIGVTSLDLSRARKTLTDEQGSSKHYDTSSNGCSGGVEDYSRPVVGNRALSRNHPAHITFWPPPRGFLQNWVAFLAGDESRRTRALSKGVAAIGGHQRSESSGPCRASNKQS